MMRYCIWILHADDGGETQLTSRRAWVVANRRAAKVNEKAWLVIFMVVMMDPR
jgi:hypothetical protein